MKHMYRQLFAWVNWKINVVFDVPTAAAAATAATGKGGAGAEAEAERTFIGILDIFGEIYSVTGVEFGDGNIMSPWGSGLRLGDRLGVRRPPHREGHGHGVLEYRVDVHG